MTTTYEVVKDNEVIRTVYHLSDANYTMLREYEKALDAGEGVVLAIYKNGKILKITTLTGDN